MEINVENIMEEIRMKIKERGESCDLLDFEMVPYESSTASNGEAFSMAAFEQNLNLANQNYLVQAYRMLSGNPIGVFIKKVIRKLSKFYVEPIVEDQNQFNVYMLRSMNSVYSYIKENNNDSKTIVQDLDKTVKMLEIKVNMLQKELDKIK